MRSRVPAAVLLPGMLLAAGLAAAQASLRSDRVVYSIHVDVADQLDLEQLRLYLREGSELLQGDQGADDAACCMELAEIGLEVFGTPGDGLDVLDAEDEFLQLLGRRALVGSILWCGMPLPNIAGCGQTPGDTMVVALDTPPELLGLTLAHERGHNAGLNHRDESCALMASGIMDGNGCLNEAECSTYRQLDRPPWSGGECGCHGDLPGQPVEPDGTSCVEDGVAGICHSDGFCDPPPPNDGCSAATPLPAGLSVLDDNDVAGTDGAASCAASGADVWYAHIADCSGTLNVDLCDAGLDVVASLHEGCGAAAGERGCAHACPTSGDCRGACLEAPVVFGEALRLRVARGGNGDTGPFIVRVSCEEDPALDSDGDGLPDVLEYGTLGTDPRAADSDGDGWDDGLELDLGTSPLLADTDGDGATDSQDVCPRVWDDQSDSGGLATPLDPLGSWPDGIGDACQCGDVSGDGVVSTLDAVSIRAFALDSATFPVDLARCAASAGGTGCGLADAVIVRRALRGLLPGIAQACPAAGP